ncbi:MAG: hydroxyacid dehydrogenase [Proteobacteria bacterium]|nr:hydroxyacid dehydrogenase [Pseudomonadota bacterium]
MAPSARARIVITNRVHQAVLDLLEPRFDVVANRDPEPWPRARLLEHGAEARALIAFMPDRVDDAFLAACPRLALIAAALKGYDNFDVAACTRRGVRLTIVPDLLTVPTAELAVGLTIAVARHLLAADAQARTGFSGWRPTFYGGGLDGSTVGIVGMGALGQAIAARLAGFGCSLRYADPRRLASDDEARLGLAVLPLDVLLATSDFVLLAAPYHPGSHHLIDRAALARLKPGAYLVNPARGSLVDEVAVADALAVGRLAGYAADTFEMEEWARPDRPSAIAPGLVADRARTVLTPHLGSAVAEARLAIELAAADNLVRWQDGAPLVGCVNPEAIP